MRRLITAALAIVLVAGCGDGTVRPEPEAEQGPPRAYGDLPQYDGDPFAGFAEVVSIELPVVADTTSQQEGGPEDEPALSGPFAIQIMALADEATARGVAETASSESGLPAHVDLEPPYWKVRLGSFPDRSAARERLGSVVDMGFEDAWVVRRTEG